MAWTTPSTAPFLAGHVPTSAEMVTHITDNFKAIGDPWTSYTPSWLGATTNPTIGNGTITGAYRSVGKYTTFRIRILMGTTTGFGSGSYQLTLPVAAIVVGNPGICGHWNDASLAVPHPVIAIGSSVSQFRMVSTDSTTYSNPTFPFTLAVGDEIIIGGTYEAA